MATSRKTQAAAPSADKRGATAPQTGTGSLRSESIAERAYQIWQASGCPHGHAQEHWFQAERELGVKPATRAAAR